MKILHLSDLHISNYIEKEEIKLGEKINEALRISPEYLPDTLLITGDFTNTGSSSEFENAYNIIDDFKNYESLNKIQNYIYVPGNHDFKWEEDGRKLKEEERKINYKNFILKKNKRSKVSNKKLQNELDKYMIQHYCEKIPNSEKYFLLIGMNTMIIDSQERSGQGYFSIKQLNIIKKLIEFYREDKSVIVMAAFHHHIIPTSFIERDTIENANKFSLTLDARLAINFFLENDVMFAVHGHQHQPSMVTWQDDMNYNEQKLHIIANGSVSASGEQLGDYKKNGFFLYIIDSEDLTIHYFCNKESYIDSFIEDERYGKKIKLKQEEIKCDVSVNAVEPSGLELKEYNANEDTSNLFYLFLNVVDCQDSTNEIDIFTANYNENVENKIIICGLHHLYGKYDILLKYRDDASNDLYYKQLLKDLLEKRCILKTSENYFMNVSYEKIYYPKEDKVPFLNNIDAYLNSTWNMATLRVETGKGLSPEKFMSQLERKISSFNQKYNTRIEDIIRNYVVGQDKSILFELFISCYQFPMLSRFTNLIEDIIREYGKDKSTHIIYYYDEREL